MSEATAAPPRSDGRTADALRPVSLCPNWVRTPLASALAQQGSTWVLCTVNVTDGVPGWLRGRGSGWLTASYSLLPGATRQRTERERRGAGGRTHEIERLIGRSLRAAVDLRGLVDCTLNVDCDVLQADGGTRTLAITGAWLALALAVGQLPPRYLRGQPLITGQVAAVSVGMVDGQALLDLDYSEDVRADTDMNVVLTADGRFVEVQATAERAAFSPLDLAAMVALARQGGERLLAAQAEVLGGIHS
jgi:ribonuclease PH